MKLVAILLIVATSFTLYAMQSLQDLIIKDAREKGLYVEWLYAKDNYDEEDVYIYKHACKLIERHSSLSLSLQDDEKDKDELLSIVFLDGHTLSVDYFGIASCGIYDLDMFLLLRSATLVGNKLKEFPYELLTLPLLQSIDVRKNKISNIGDTQYIRKLCQQHESLKVIKLSGNNLWEFPSVLLLLPCLQDLSLARNPKINMLWDAYPLNERIKENQSLERLTLDYNQLTFFPHVLLYFKKLLYLSLFANKIRFLIRKEKIVKLCREKSLLKTINLGDNPIDSQSCYPLIIIPEVELNF